MFFVQSKEGTRVNFDSEEIYGCNCPRCEREHMLDEDEFWQVMDGYGDLYGGGVYCQECSARLQEGANARN